MAQVRFMTEADLDGAALVHKATFVRQQHSRNWLQCNLNAAPRFLNFVAESEGEIVGYIIWVQKSGFRPEAVLELEQLAVLPSAQGQGLGKTLILDSPAAGKTAFGGSRLDAQTRASDHQSRQLCTKALSIYVGCRSRNHDFKPVLSG